MNASIHQLSRDDALRLIGHRDGVTTAIMAVRNERALISYRYENTPAHHTKKLRERDILLAPLVRLESQLRDEVAHNRRAIDSQKSLTTSQ